MIDLQQCKEECNHVGIVVVVVVVAIAVVVNLDALSESV